MPRRRSNQAKWMRNPRIVRWDLAEVAYEADKELGPKHFRGDLRNPRMVVEEQIRKLRHEQTEAGEWEKYREALERGLRGD